MRTIDWLKSLRTVPHRDMRRSVRRVESNSRVAHCELLETRQLLSAMSVSVDIGASEQNSVQTTESFYLPPQQRLSGTGSLLSVPVAGEPLDVAIGFLRDHAAELSLSTSDLDEFVVSSQYTDEQSGTTHIYLRQTFDGLEVMHADISISLTARNEVIHVASSFVRDAQPTDDVLEPFVVSAAAAFQEWSDDKGLDLPVVPRVVSTDKTAADAATLLALDGTALEDVAAKLVYVPTEHGLERAWQLDVHDADYEHWFTAYVSATDGESLYTNGNVEFATYNVYAFPTTSPITGSRSVVNNPSDPLASPYGWHDTNGVAGAEFTDTRGNNASVQEDGNHDNVGGFRPDGGANLNFDFPLDTAQDPALYQSAAITNAYYWVNLLHDIHYQYGFTEAAGNFQVNNYGRGGLGNDPLMVDIQDGDGGTDGFAALPDGQSPRMSLYKRDNPYRDRAYDSEIIIHEFGHGISERLTGGPGNTTALNAVQSKGMGEGWGDWWALMLTQVSTDAKLDAYGIGNYAAGFAPNGPGIRQYPYSFDKAVDPLTYANFNGGAVNNEQHKAGTIWASALWDMNWLLIDKHGFSPDMLHGNGGNNLALRLVMDGLKLQGTNPSFLAGRDAILAADVALTGGANQTEIWTAFARRGMGFSASDGGGAGATTVVEAFDVPANIRGTVFRDDDGNGAQNGNEPGLAGRAVYLDKNNNGIQDVATTSTFTQTPNGALPDAQNIKFTKTISGLSGVITDINLTVNVTHPNDGDLYITLISPAGTPVILSNYLGDTGDNFTNTTFDDEASSYISEGSAPFTGSFKPYFNLSQLDGRDPNGTWTLRFDDRAAGNTGTLLSWSLQISSGSVDPVTITDANGDYTFFGLGNSTQHVRDIVPTGFTQTAPANGLRDVVIANSQSVVDQDFGVRAAASIANTSTLQNTLSSAITVTPPANLGVTHFKVSGITNGTLFKNDGSTPVTNGSFITVAEGAAGLRFMPSANSTLTGHFDVELSANGSSVIANTSKASGTITVGSLGSFSLSKSTLTVSETGSTETFTAVLTTQPTSNVVLSITSSDLTEATVSAPTLIFTPANWNIAQTVTITGANDSLDDGDIASSVTVSVVDAQSDDAFDPLADQSVSITTTDNDQAGFTLTQTGGSTIVTEAGSTDTFTVVLTAQPTSNVVLSVTSGDTTEATVSAPTLTFTPANWNVAQTVTVTGVNDVLNDGDIVSNVTISVVDVSSDNLFDPLPDQSVSITTTDNDQAGFALTQTGGSTSVTEAGSTDTFTVVLTAQPISNVVLSVTSGDTTEATVSAPTLTFTPANWNVAQTVTVTGVNDAIDDGDIASNVTVSVVDASSDNTFDPLPDQSVPVTTLDNDGAGFVIVESGGLTSVTEAGSIDMFTVVLTAQPTSNVVLSVVSTNGVEPDISPSTLIFTPANWNTPATVYVRGVDDLIDDGNVISTITISVVDGSSDDTFDPVANQTVNVTTIDDDASGFVITPSDGTTSVTEAGSTDTFSVVLTSQPTSNVVLAVTSNDTTEATVSTPLLTFTPANWNVAQIVTATGVDDQLVDGTQVASIKLSVTDAASDNTFDPLADQIVSVSTIDNDTAGFTVTQSDGSTQVSETGSTDTFSVVLNAQPNSTVVIALGVGDATEFSINKSSLIFTSANWNTPQTVTASGVNDFVIDGNQSANITLSINASASDDNFDSIASQSVSVTTLDDDVAGFTVTQSGSDTAVSEYATTDNFNVVLTAQPNSNVELQIVSSDEGEATVTSKLTFTSANWNVAQVVTVTGVDDDIIDGAQVSQLTISIVSESSDDNFDAVTSQAVNVTTNDNDVAGFALSKQTASVSESGTTDSFSVVLNTSPTSDVVLSVTSGDVNQVSVDSATLTFTSSNWNVAQVITVTGVADHINDGAQVTPVTISVVDDQSDDLFDSLADQSIAVTVTNSNSAPSITAGVGSLEVPENSATVTTISATDPDANTTLSFSLLGTDAGQFNITSGGVISFKVAPNFEVDAQSYSFDVVVSDGSLSDSQAVSVTISDVNEAPTILSGTSKFNVSENSTVVTTINAFDPDANTTLNFSLTGSDADQFQVTDAGEISFKVAPNFEVDPTSYSFDVVVSDGSLADSRTLSINVTDIDEVAPTVDVVDVTPDPRQSQVGVVSINFSESVTGVDVADFQLTRNGVPVSLNGLNVIGSGSTYSVNLSSATAASGSYELTLLAAGSGITDAAGNLLINDASDAWTVLLGTNINVTLTGSESLRIVRNGLNVDVIRNNVVDSSFVFVASLVQSITVVGGTGNNAIDLSGVTLATFPSLSGITVSGGTGNDAITGSDFSDVLNGDAGNDTLLGGLGNDSLNGGIDNDVLTGGAGADVLAAGDGIADILYESTPSDLVLKPTQLAIGAGDSVVIDSISGFEKAMLLGGGTANLIDASAANIPVSLFGGGGNDVLLGGSQADSIDGQAGNDTLTGGGGNDSLVGGLGLDGLREVAYSDFVAGQTRSITLTNSSLLVKQGATTLSSDFLSGFEFADLTGGAMRDLINATGFTNTGVTSLSGGGGNDVISGTSGADIISTLTGADSISGNGGSDTVFSGSGNDTLNGGDGDDNLNGQNGDDSILGDGGNDVLVGGAGLDTMLGGAGNDFLNGLTDPGLFFGGDGNDTLQGNTLNDTLNGDAGDDRLYGMQGNDILAGGDGADALYGGSGNDTLAGGAGIDTLQGDVGSDLIDGGDDFDRINEMLDTNITIVGINVSSTGLGVDAVFAVERIQLVGGPGNNFFDARQAVVPVLLSGGAGNDTLLGGLKADGIEGGDGDDVVSGGAGADVISGGSGFDYWFEKADANFTVNALTVSSAVTGTETATGIDAIALIGGVGANKLDATLSTVPVVLIGGRGNDTLLGGSAADTLSGGNRNDATVVGGDGTDSLDGGLGADTLENDPLDTKVTGAGDATIADVFTLLPNWIDTL